MTLQKLYLMQLEVYTRHLFEMATEHYVTLVDL